MFHKLNKLSPRYTGKVLLVFTFIVISTLYSRGQLQNQPFVDESYVSHNELRKEIDFETIISANDGVIKCPKDMSQVLEYIDLDSTKIILLGEERHGQQDVIALNIELIKALHKKYGFNTILIESDAWNLDGSINLETINNSVYKVWSETTPFVDLLNYMNSTGMQLYGIDSKIYNKNNARDVVQFVREQSQTILKEDLLNHLCLTIEEAILREFESTFTDENLHKAIDQLEILLEKKTIPDAYRLKIIKEYLELIQIERKSSDQYIQQREIFMVNNVEYLVNSLLKNQKIIVIGASMHTQPGATLLSKHATENVGDRMKKIDSSSLSIQTMVGKGYYRLGNSDRIAQIEKAKKNSVRHELNKQKIECALLNLKFIEASGKHLYSDKIKAENFGDYVIFINHTKPTKRLYTEPLKKNP